jgi:predicted amidohydrolase YtcJ
VLPGFQDPHLHVPEAGINQGLCLLDPGLTLDDYGELLARCADDQPDSSWVRAAGASLFDLRHSQELPIDVLDRMIPDRPALVLDDLGHGAWTNTLGLKAAGIGADDPNPQGGVLHRDPVTGRLTGLVLEDAQQAVRNVAAVDAETAYAGLLVALDELAHNGITSISDAGGYWQQNHPATFQRALAENRLTVRAVNALYLYPSLDIDSQLAELEQRFDDDPDSPLRYNTVKIYIDGILDLGTAAMIEPYDVAPDENYPNGFTYFQTEQLQRYVSELHRIGYKLHFHVIGDAATRMALDAIEAIDADPREVADRRHRLTHTYLVDPADVPRFAQLGVVADFQVGPESSATDYHEYLSESIGQRAFDLIPVKTLLDSGAHVSLSSDWDADPLSPFGTIQRAVTRDENAVDTVEQAIELVTLSAAYALSQDDMTGSIEVGKYADYVIVDQNLLEIDVGQIGDTTVMLTVVGGRQTYRSPELGT